MKSWYFLPFLLLLITGCELEEITPNSAPPILGFGTTSGTILVTGGTTEARILWTQPTIQAQQIEFTVEGDGSSQNDLELLTTSPISVPAGATEIAIQLAVAPGQDPERTERKGIIKLQSADWFRLSVRDSFAFKYGVPHTVELDLWAPDLAFPQLWGYTSFNADPVPDGNALAAGRHFCFAHKSRTSANVIGLYNAAEGRSTNALNMHRLYSDYNVSGSSANIRMPELFRLIPSSPGARSGTVEVIRQRVTISRRSASGMPPFTVGLSGSGTYDEISGSINVAILFDESELGIAEPVLRRYVYEAEER
jgi:hypothetical protein